MAKRLLIDTGHPEETRVVVLDGTRLEEFDVETSTKKQIKGNVYLAKVVRVEPSLQAAFVEYGGNRHGFLAFSEIHPDYYQIPVADRQALIAEQTERQRAAEAEDDHNGDGDAGDGDDSDGDGGDAPDGNGNGAPREVEDLGGEETVTAASPRTQANALRNYKIQEVIKRRQILLVQVVKEERGNKGAALTTYLSLAGRYCVFMPNTARGGGVSRKISSQTDRRRLKAILSDLHGPPGGSVILRTAGAERSKAEIKRDFEYLTRQWELIKETTLQSMAPALIHEEANLIKRAIRDIYTRDVEEILVDGEDGYRAAKDFMKMLTPSHARKVKPYRETAMPLFHRFQVESQLDAMHSPVAQLRSGGYVVINQTEALVAIDVNSGKSTKERHIEETALKTNLEAADEIARQLRLRDLAGLIVIDFIDMDDNRNNAAVERRLKEALKQDRARIQMSRISAFGLLEMSRQRLRPSLMETAFHTCQQCHGTGVVRSIESTAIAMLRVIEEEGVRRRSSEVTLRVPTPVALYILNNKRAMLTAIESRYDFRVNIEGDDSLIIPAYTMDRIRAEGRPDAPPETTTAPPAIIAPDDEDDDDPGTETDTDAEADDARPSDRGRGRDRDTGERDEDDGGSRKKRRRRRRKPRREGDRETDRDGESNGDGGDDQDGGADDAGQGDAADGDAGGESDAEGRQDGEGADEDGNGPRRSRRPRRRRGGRRNRTRANGEGTGETEGGEAGSDAEADTDTDTDTDTETDRWDGDEPSRADEGAFVEATSDTAASHADDSGSDPTDEGAPATADGAASVAPVAANDTDAVADAGADAGAEAGASVDAPSDAESLVEPDAPPPSASSDDTNDPGDPAESAEVDDHGADEDGAAGEEAVADAGDGDAQPTEAETETEAESDETRPVRRGWWRR
ncbi:Rne/Rng family ribonuclease [Roseospira navarrensis]|uniref:Ribonuclease E n=1 Tax=Roseospira navarrensis TaxID=140058 RepID=A0A7X2D356_9PROT|nr:Rne/Rng family ribonuclease [Roseospira navarrensis]MQX36473.1 Rne/Rng family ribonuclease [Roseospira navarrensis]